MQDTEKKRLEEILNSEMEKLSELTSTYVEQDVSVRKMEVGYLTAVLMLCLNLLKFVISVKIIQKSGVRPKEMAGEKISNKGQRIRKYLSIFGSLEFSRTTYHSKDRGLMFVLDECLSFPPDLWSYNIQELIGGNASETGFRESVRLLNSLLNLNLSASGSERGIARLGNFVEEYYEHKSSPKPEGLVHLSASFDGKGVPKIIENKTQKGVFRLGKGEKRGLKQMATVAVMSWFRPKYRNSESVLDGLMGTHKPPTQNKVAQQKEKVVNDNKWHRDIHRRGFLANQQKSVDYGISYIKSIINHPESRFVVPIDAGIGLEDCILASVKKHGMEDCFDGVILDIIHVSEYVWNCANAIFGEQSKVRHQWVRDLLKDLLESKVGKVTDDLKKIVDKANLSETKNKAVSKAITYFTNHGHKMDYKSYLEKGYPISSALVESNCRHFVKDRMEQGGMRWSSSGAQNMLDVRAVKMNGDLTDFIDYIELKNRKTAA